MTDSGDFEVGDKVKWYDPWSQMWYAGRIEQMQDNECYIKCDVRIWKNASKLEVYFD